jgi:ABC-type lipoprotein export system ATPase subunit
MISLQKVTRRYHLDEETIIEPVTDVSMDIRKGELFIIIGRSGCGKTTLLNLMAGLIKPTSGKVLIDGVDIEKMNDRQLSEMRSRKIGFVFQFPSLLPSLKVIDNVMLPRIFISKDGLSPARERAKQLLKMVGLKDRMEVFPRQLSAGEQKRAVIARALINEPQILLTDEPTSDLDEKTEQEVMSILLNIRDAGVTVLMVTHNLQLVPYANRAFKMENGVLTPVSGTDTLSHSHLIRITVN